MGNQSGPARRRRLAAGTAVLAAAALLQPLTAAPAHAGFACALPFPLPGDDCVAPETKFTEKPTVDAAGKTTRTSATFKFTTQTPESGVTFECKLEGAAAPVGHDWTDCTDAAPAAGTSTGTKAYTGLPVGGPYTFSVRANDNFQLGPNVEATPETFSWTVAEPDGPPDDEDPNTIITAGGSRWYPFPFIGVEYMGNEDTAGFECTFGMGLRPSDAKPLDCGEGQKNIFGMQGGDYIFTVAAVDQAGNVDPTPAVSRWTVPMNNTQLARHSKGALKWEKRTGRGHFQDSYSLTRAKGAWIEQGRRGFKALALVATRCPDCGTVRVLIGTKQIATVRLAAPTPQKRRVLPLGSWRKAQQGIVRVEVVSSGKDVIIEGLGFSARR